MEVWYMKKAKMIILYLEVSHEAWLVEMYILNFAYNSHIAMFNHKNLTYMHRFPAITMQL